MNRLVIQSPVTLCKASIELPLSKSIANRMLVIGYLADSESLVRIPNSKDSVTMQRLIQGLRNNNIKDFDSGDAGTVFRFLTALLSVIPGDRTLTGSHRMKQRPVGPLVNALRSLGADISYSENEGYPPIAIHGKKPEGGYVSIDGSVSSQFISALMMIGPLMKNGLKIMTEGSVVSWPYIELTAGLMRTSGIEVQIDGSEITIQPGIYTLNSDLSEADWSAASYWYALVSLVPGSSLLLKGLRQQSLQGDSKLTDIFSPLGVVSEWSDEGLLISYSGNRVDSFEINLNGQPDLAPAIATACAGNQINAKLTGLETLVIKESNRLEALNIELAKLGYQSEIEDNNTFIVLPGDSSVKSNLIDTYNDHRIAMSMAVLGAIKSPLNINDPRVVDKSYPDFWDHLRKCGFVVSAG